MSRRRYVWYQGDWIEVDRYAPPPRPAGPMVIRDIEPFRSVATADRAVIGGRRQLREYCALHGLEQVGNERLPPRPAPQLPPVREALRMAHEMHRTTKQPGKD